MELNRSAERIFRDICDEIESEIIMESVKEVINEEEEKKEAKNEEEVTIIELTQEEIQDLLMTESTGAAIETNGESKKLDDEIKLSQEEIQDLLQEELVENIDQDFIIEDIENIGDGINDEDEDSIMLDYVKKNRNINTNKKTAQVIRRFREWLLDFKQESRELIDIPAEKMNRYIGTFLMDLKKQNGEEMEPDTITSFHRGIDRHLRDINYPELIMSSDKFRGSREVLTAKRKDLKAMGLGNKPNRAETITDDMVEKLWASNELGESTPRTVQNTVFFFLTQCFGSRGSHESYQMSWGDVELKTDDNEKEYLVFNEKQSKTRTGELGTGVRAFAPKIWSSETDRCPIRYYKMFREHRPGSMCEVSSPFYLTVKNKLKANDNVWYANMAMGKNTISKIVPKMAEKSGLKGKITNHSLRKKVCQELLSAEVPPVIICQLTGHKNVNSLQNYTIADINQQKNMSKILTEASTNKKESVPSIEGPKMIALPSTSQISVQKSKESGLEKLVKASSGILGNSTIHGTVNLNINFNVSSSQCLNVSPKPIASIE